MKWFTGVGSRETPPEILQLMTKISMGLEKGNYGLRSGGADGADSAFEKGIINDKNKSIYLPYKGFNKNNSNKYNEPSEEALSWARKVHPYFDKAGDFARKAHARNAHQVLGDNLDSPAECVICWTPDGAEKTDECHSIEVTGGTRTAIAIATLNNIPVFNLARPDALTRLIAFIKSDPIPTRERWSPDPVYINEIIKQKREKKANSKKRKTSSLQHSF